MVKHLSREYNVCDACAKQCMRDARQDDWRFPVGTSATSIEENGGLVKALDEVSANLRKLEKGAFDSKVYSRLRWGILNLYPFLRGRSIRGSAASCEGSMHEKGDPGSAASSKLSMQTW